MARLYLLDTTILSHLVRQPQGPVAERIADAGEANVVTSVVVACDLRYGAARRGIGLEILVRVPQALAEAPQEVAEARADGGAARPCVVQAIEAAHLAGRRAPHVVGHALEPLS